VVLHATFPIFVLVLGLFVLATEGLTEALLVLATLVSLFGFVLLHELGHSLVAQRLGVSVRSITLLPLGGVALTENLPRRPRDEILIALAGPAVNFLLVLIFFTARASGALGGEFITYVLVANLMLGGFNLVPAFPLDGGRVLRALLATRLPYVTATSRAVVAGRVFAVLFVAAGFFRPSLIMLGLIGVFLFIAGGRELRGVRMDELLNRRSVEEFMESRPWFYATRDTVFGEVCGVLGENPDLAYTVIEMEALRFGLLDRRELLSACMVMPPGLPLSRLVERVHSGLPAGASVAMALGRLRRQGSPILPLIKEGEVIGLVSRGVLEEQLRGLSGRGFSINR
jgi:Zn-dependent protease